MIKYFAVENFRSIKSEVVLDFDIGTKNKDFISNPVIGITGANASGKTTIIQALTFTLWFMQSSFLRIDENDLIPLEPFGTTPNNPTKLHIIFTHKTKIDDIEKYIDYDYEIYLTREHVISETLNYYPYNRRRLAYQRDGKRIKIGNSLTVPMGDLEGFQKDLRPNCSLISYASQYSSQKIAMSCKNYHFISNVSSDGLQDLTFKTRDARNLETIDPEHRRIKRILKLADVGIEDFSLEEIPEELVHEAITTLQNLTPEQREILPLPKTFFAKLDQIREDPINNPPDLLQDVVFQHHISGDFMNFELKQESSGTKKFLAIFSRVFTALQYGRCLFLDEIELKLHQNLVAYLIGLFQNPHENPHGGQLIFSFHNTSLMTILDPEQLWFTEKNDFGETELFSAIDFEDIKNIHKKDLEKLYRIGRFGAVPRGL